MGILLGDLITAVEVYNWDIDSMCAKAIEVKTVFPVNV